MKNVCVSRKCSCGEDRPHRVAWRRTSDGVSVELWDSGELTGASGLGIKGVPIVRPRDDDARAAALSAGWLVADELARTNEDPEASLYSSTELPLLYATARRLVASRGLGVTPGELRAAFAEAEERDAVARFPIRWEYVAPGARAGYLPRIRWPGIALWHENGVYEVMLIRRVAGLGGRSGETLVTTGFKFKTLRETIQHLLTQQGSPR